VLGRTERSTKGLVVFFVPAIIETLGGASNIVPASAAIVAVLAGANEKASQADGANISPRLDNARAKVEGHFGAVKRAGPTWIRIGFHDATERSLFGQIKDGGVQAIAI